MFSGLDVFKTASALASYATTRQSAISQNIANADTPGYKSTDLKPFADAYADRDNFSAMRATRPTHFAPETAGYALQIEEFERGGDLSPNGNSVSLETEMVSAAEVKFSHDLALTVYRSGLTLLRTSLGSRS